MIRSRPRKRASTARSISLGLAKRLRCRILQASTSEVYEDPNVHPQREEYWGNVNPIGLRACYDEGKRCAESLFYDYHRQHGLPIKVARIFNTYGPRMHMNDGRVVSNFIVQALQDKPITVYGSGEQTRAFCYFSDIVNAFELFMETLDEVSRPINLGSPDEITIRTLAELIVDKTGSGSKIIQKPLPSDDPVQRCPDITRAREILGWSPKIGLDEGLEKTIAHFEQVLRGTRSG
jgi:UDP-glucuronate decarboxylase